MTSQATSLLLPTLRGPLHVWVQGEERAPTVVMTHSILCSSMMWERQAGLLAQRGFRVVRVDARGHGRSPAAGDTCTMVDLADDTIAVMDALDIDRVHYVGLSLGGMSGFGLALRHPRRIASLVLCAARADTPPPVAAPWDERIEIARAAGSCEPLAASTLERWFGRPFLDAHPDLARRFHDTAAQTTVDGFVACARAIQSLDYLEQVLTIDAPTTLIVGANDGVLPQAMAELRLRIRGSELRTIASAGHLPNVDQPESFDAALLDHFDRVAGAQ